MQFTYVHGPLCFTSIPEHSVLGRLHVCVEGGEGGSVCMCVGACMHACVYMHTDGNVNVLRTRNLQYCGQGAASGHLSQAHTSGAAKG